MEGIRVDFSYDGRVEIKDMKKAMNTKLMKIHVENKDRRKTIKWRAK